MIESLDVWFSLIDLSVPTHDLMVLVWGSFFCQGATLVCTDTVQQFYKPRLSHTHTNCELFVSVDSTNYDDLIRWYHIIILSRIKHDERSNTSPFYRGNILFLLEEIEFVIETSCTMTKRAHLNELTLSIWLLV